MSKGEIPAISFRNVSKRFVLQMAKPQTVLEKLIATVRRERQPTRELWAVRDLTLDVMPGQSLGIIGRNGAGKSTLLKLVARIFRPTGGMVQVTGRVSALLELGAGFHPDLTGRENIYLNGSVLGLSKQDVEESYQAIVDFSELEEFIDMPVKHYSSGMYMRLGFSVAIHVEPDILLIDEILAVGDQAFQEKCVERIHTLQRQGVTIVLISHHSEVIRSICSHALWIEHGEVQDAGPMNTVLAAYNARFAQQSRKRGQGMGFRWGTGEMEIEGVRLCSPDGNEQESFPTDSPLLISIEYRTRRPIHQPHFEIAFFRLDGIQVSSSRPMIIADDSGRLTGSGVVTYLVKRLPLVPGEYLLTVSVHDGHWEHAYDRHELAYPFTVPGNEDPAAGMVVMPARWDWSPSEESELFKI